MYPKNIKLIDLSYLNNLHSQFSKNIPRGDSKGLFIAQEVSLTKQTLPQDPEIKKKDVEFKIFFGTE
jgi:hypothetical protein